MQGVPLGGLVAVVVRVKETKGPESWELCTHGELQHLSERMAREGKSRCPAPQFGFADESSPRWYFVV